ncbi:MAG: serine hydrolase domain-containing protein [Pontixanthobacter sp.]
MTRIVLALLGATMLAGCAGTMSAPVAQSQAPGVQPAQSFDAGEPQDVRLTMPPASVTPADLDVLFWNDAERSARFRDMESWFPGREVPTASVRRRWPKGAPLTEPTRRAIARFMEETNSAGVMVLEGGSMRHEAYGLGMTPQDRWTSFSVAKSFTSTLLGAALKDGAIASLDDPVVRYIPEMAGSAYENVTVRQVATMTSGIRWNESYTDPKSDVAMMASIVAAPGENAIVTQLKSLPREAPAGEKFVYKTGETNLLGVLVERATGRSLADYAKDKIVDPAGFASPMFWMIDPSGANIGGCCLSLTLHDYARMGQFVLDGGNGAVPDRWFDEAGAEQVSFGGTGFGYGYQWWTYPGTGFGAQGIFGQAITILPDEKLVVAAIGNWSTATSTENRRKWQELVERIASER